MGRLPLTTRKLLFQTCCGQFPGHLPLPGWASLTTSHELSSLEAADICLPQSRGLKYPRLWQICCLGRDHFVAHTLCPPQVERMRFCRNLFYKALILSTRVQPLPPKHPSRAPSPHTIVRTGSSTQEFWKHHNAPRQLSHSHETDTGSRVHLVRMAWSKHI